MLNQLKRTEGQALVLFAAAMTAFMALTATVVDVGMLILVRQRIQDTVDIAALAAGQDLPDATKASATATAYVKRNRPNDKVTVTFPDSQTVVVQSAGSVKYTFARVIGVSSSAVSASGSAAAGRIGQALDYTLFSGSKTTTLETNGQNIYFEGNAHTNKNFLANGQGITVTGRCEAVTTITSSGAQIHLPHPVPYSPYVPMPDFSATLKAKAQKNGSYFVGDKTFKGTQITVNSSIYVEGNVVITGAKFTGKGVIIATGNITFNGSGQRVNAADAFAFYSKNGNVTVTGTNLTVDGILYAPNGQVFMDGNNQTIHGRVIGNTVAWNGSDFNITSNPNDLNALPSTGVKLVH